MRRRTVYALALCLAVSWSNVEAASNQAKASSGKGRLSTHLHGLDDDDDDYDDYDEYDEDYDDDYDSDDYDDYDDYDYDDEDDELELWDTWTREDESSLPGVMKRGKFLIDEATLAARRYNLRNKQKKSPRGRKTAHSEQSGEAIANMGVEHAMAGRMEEALPYFERAVLANDDVWTNHNNLAMAYLHFRRNAEALVHYKEALRTDPNNEQADIQRKNVKALTDMLHGS